MAKKSMAELVHTAYLTGVEAEFTENGITYTFTPEGLKSYIQAEFTDNGITYTFTPEGLKSYIQVDMPTQYTDTMARDAIKTKTQVDALVSPEEDFTDLTEATAAIKAIIDALKA